MTIDQDRTIEATLLAATVSRYTDKLWDWDAFPASRGYPELARAQMRYIGAGGSPKVGDTSTLPAHQFTCSLLHQESGRYAAVHGHEIEEIFLIREGRMTVSWDFDDHLVDVVLGPGDALVNPAGRAHGFRNEGPGPVMAQFMVGHPKPMLPQYKTHPSNGNADPGFGSALPSPDDPRGAEIARHVVRAGRVPTVWYELSDGGRFAVQPYVMPADQGGVVQPGHFSLQMLFLPPGTTLPPVRRDHDVALMVWQGQLEAAISDDGQAVTTSLGPLDLLRIAPGQQAGVRNSGPGIMQAAVAIGSAAPAADLWTAKA